MSEPVGDYMGWTAGNGSYQGYEQHFERATYAPNNPEFATQEGNQDLHELQPAAKRARTAEELALLSPSSSASSAAGAAAVSSPLSPSSSGANDLNASIDSQASTSAADNQEEDDSDDTVKKGEGKQLWELLSKTKFGKQLLSLRKNVLSSEQRAALAEMIVPEFCDVNEPYGQTITRRVYIFWQSQIIAVFSGERNKHRGQLYFHIQPSVNRKTGKEEDILTGALVARANTVRKTLQNKAKRIGLSKAAEEEAPEVIPTAQPDPAPLPADEQQIKQKLAYIKAQAYPDEKLLSYWNDTRTHRTRLGYTSNPFVDYKCLRAPSGIELVTADFDHKHPVSKNNLSLKWVAYAEAIKQLAIQKKCKEVNKFEGVSSDLSAIYLLNYILKPVNITFKNTDGVIVTVKPTRDEARKTTIIHCESRHLLEEKISGMVDLHLARKSLLQPFLVVVGDLKQPEAYYLVISSTVKYHFTSLIPCLSACFKSFFELDLLYPLYSYRFWLIIQREIFGIVHRLDKYSQVSDIAATLDEMVQ